MASAGALTIDLNANTARLRSDFNKAGAMTKKYKRQSVAAFDAVKRAVFSLKGGIVSLVGVGGLSALIKSSIEYGDALGKTSDKLGLTVESLQQLRFAAELAGVPVTSLDIGMQRFTRRIGEAAEGTGVLKNVFDELGIPLRNLDGSMRKTEDILYDYADAIQGAESSQKKLLLTFKAFDTEGVAMLNMLGNGSKSLKDVEQQARDTGGIMSSVLVETATVINDRWTILTDTIGSKFKIAVLTAVDSVMNLFGVFNNLGDVQGRLIVLEDTLLEAQIRGENQIGRNARATNKRIDALKEEQIELQNLERIITESRMARDNIVGLGGAAASSGGSGGDSRGVADSSVSDAEFDAAVASFDALDELHDERSATFLEKEKEKAALWDQVWANSINNFAGGIGNAVGDAVVDQKNLGEALKATMKGVAKQVISSLVEIGIKRAIMSATAQAQEKVIIASNVGSAATVAGAWAAAEAAVSLATLGANAPPAAAGIASTHALSNSLALAGAREFGGPVSAGNAYLVGEKRPEIFVPNRSGTILPNTDSVGVSDGAESSPTIVFSPVVQAYDADSILEQEDKVFSAMLNRFTDWMNENGKSFA